CISLVPACAAPCCVLFPYTTLFRSGGCCDPSVVFGLVARARCAHDESQGNLTALDENGSWGVFWQSCGGRQYCRRVPRFRSGLRSEEHTSELQSRENLVCRLLLEKK